jgi:hypothetical protein
LKRLKCFANAEQKGVLMKLVRRIAIALGSISALMLAGGAHFKVT